MSEENSALSATLKAGTGFDAPWIVLRADNAEDLKDLIVQVRNEELSFAVAEAAVEFGAAYVSTAGLGAAVQAPLAQVVPISHAAPVAAATAVAAGVTSPNGSAGSASQTDKWGNVYTWNVPGAPSCPHGVRILKEGKQKNGAPYSAYQCSVIDQYFKPQTSCATEYVR